MNYDRRVRSDGRSVKNDEQRLVMTYEMLRHERFRKLKGSSVKVLIELGTRHTGFNNGKIGCSYDELAKTLKIGKTTISNAIKELERNGFLVVTARGHFNDPRASEFELTFLFSKVTPTRHLWKDPDQRPKERNYRPNKKTRGHLSETAEMIHQEKLKRSSQNGTVQP